MAARHPVIEMLLLRKKTHPEEFVVDGRWDRELKQLGWFMTDTEKQEFFSEYRKQMFDTVQHQVMEKLLTGEPHE